MDLLIIPIVSLAITSILFGIAYLFETVTLVRGILVGLLAFTLSTAFSYWISASFTCPDQKSDSREKIKTKLSWLDYLKSFFGCNTKSGLDKPAGGIVVYRRTPVNEYLHLTEPEQFLFASVSKNKESLQEAALRGISKKTGIYTENFSVVPNFSKDTHFEETDSKGKIHSRKFVTYWLAEVSPDVKIPKTFKWLTLNEAMTTVSNKNLIKILLTCDLKINRLKETDMRMKNSPAKEEAQVKDEKNAPAKEAYGNGFLSQETGEFWRVLERRKRQLVFEKPQSESKIQEKSSRSNYYQSTKVNCTTEVVTNAFISSFATFIVMSIVSLLVHFFPDAFEQLKSFILNNLTQAKDAVQQLLVNVYQKIQGDR